MQKIIDKWLVRDPDPKTRDELQGLVLANDEQELERRFNGRLAFGTAGLRGVVGAGPARMNRLVIRETSAGLGRYLIENVPDAKARGVLVAYDGRLDSQQFAEDAACVFAALGMQVYLTDRETATPVGAFGVKHLGCAAGVVVTASHNPPEYNGYKVYWQNGAQIIPPHDGGIACEIEKAAIIELPWVDFGEAKRGGQIIILADGFIEQYIAAITSSPLFKERQKDLPPISVAYTAMHGVGAPLAEQMLGETGFCEVHSVASQREPDGRFPTVNFPNPEEPGAMDAVIELACEKDTLLACANDPDADRLAIAVREHKGSYKMLSGDQIGILLGAYLLAKSQDRTPIICATIVSSSMLGKIAVAAKAKFHATLTGFKWLTNVALDEEAAHADELNNRFLFAYEEALGYAVSRAVWDKDGLSALLAFVQMTAELTAAGTTVVEELQRLYIRHGLHLNLQQSIPLLPNSPSVGDLLRAKPLSSIAGKQVISTDDIKLGIRSYADGRTEPIALPLSDVLIYHLADAGRVIVRPSGTEPKLKCYYELVYSISDGEIFADIEMAAETELNAMASKFHQELKMLMKPATNV